MTYIYKYIHTHTLIMSHNGMASVKKIVKTVGNDPNCVLFVTVEIRTRVQLVFGLDSVDRVLLDLEDKGHGKCRIVREDVEVWWSVIVLTLLTEGTDTETCLIW